MYPQTLGVKLITSEIISKIGINARMLSVNATFECLRMAHTRRREIATMIAYNCVGSEHVHDIWKVDELASFIADNTDLSELTLLLMLVITDDSLDRLLDKLGIRKENEQKLKYSAAKVNKSTYVFGGVSIYGGLIDIAKEKLNESYHNILWGISYENLKLMLEDATTSIFLTDDERQKNNLPLPGVKPIKVTSSNIEQIKAMFKEN